MQSQDSEAALRAKLETQDSLLKLWRVFGVDMLKKAFGGDLDDMKDEYPLLVADMEVERKKRIQLPTDDGLAKVRQNLSRRRDSEVVAQQHLLKVLEALHPHIMEVKGPEQKTQSSLQPKPLEPEPVFNGITPQPANLPQSTSISLEEYKIDSLPKYSPFLCSTNFKMGAETVQLVGVGQTLMALQRSRAIFIAALEGRLAHL